MIGIIFLVVELIISMFLFLVTLALLWDLRQDEKAWEKLFKGVKHENKSIK